MIVLDQWHVVQAADADRAGVEFFEQKIRPVLVERCYSCHSRESEKVKGGLLLDTREGLLKGGETGPAIISGDPEKSLLIKAVRYADENLQMPPKNKKLSPEQIADLATWIKIGTPDPRTGAAKITAGPPLSDPAKVRDHWAFKPVRNSALPAVKNFRWVKTPIDVFILAKLEEKRIPPALAADKRTLIRRATLDLTGLPPTPEEVEAFVADPSPSAFAKVVDRLLASPQYGERWARHWLDVARYADTKGYVFEEERRYPYSYTYRDYVIRALNEDLPYDQFLIQQIAADLLPLGDDKRPLAALGFLTLGRRFLNSQPDIIDDRIDVITRGTMALTAQCARCHDHKYDPIPTRDYYSLYGVFASCDEPAEKPLLGDAAMPKEYPEYLAERKKRETEMNTFRETTEADVRTQLRQHVGDYLLAALDTQRLEDKSKAEALARERKLAPGVVNRWLGALDTWSKTNHPIFAPWFEFVSLGETNFAERAQSVVEKYSKSEAAHSLNRLVAEAFVSSTPGSIKEVAERYNKIFAGTDTRWRESSKTNAELRPCNRTYLCAVTRATKARKCRGSFSKSSARTGARRSRKAAAGSNWRRPSRAARIR
ncbi:MAG: DUF1549 domain-containing protein [Verrucomicrobia bacterium]|nr:DUF1549 domain-containing protein [Verrucomicrobiota bacterium]